MNALTGLANQKRIAGILAEFNSILDRESPRIAQITDQISLLAKHADSVVVSAKPVMPNIDRTVTNVNGMVDEIRPPLTKSISELDQRGTRSPRAAGRRTPGGRTNEQELAETVRNLRATSENLRDLSETIKQRPWNLIHHTATRSKGSAVKEMRSPYLVTLVFLATLVPGGCGHVRYPTNYVLNFPPASARIAPPPNTFGPLVVREFQCPQYLCRRPARLPSNPVGNRIL